MNNDAQKVGARRPDRAVKNPATVFPRFGTQRFPDHRVPWASFYSPVTADVSNGFILARAILFRVFRVFRGFPPGFALHALRVFVVYFPRPARPLFFIRQKSRKTHKTN